LLFSDNYFTFATCSPGELHHGTSSTMAPSAIFISRPEATIELEEFELKRSTLLKIPSIKHAASTAGLQLIPFVADKWSRKLLSPLVWDGSRYACSKEYIYRLSTIDKAELECAVAHFKCTMTWLIHDNATKG
jgi:hypothetical protein